MAVRKNSPASGDTLENILFYMLSYPGFSARNTVTVNCDRTDAYM